MSMMNGIEEQEQPPALYSYNLVNPSIPLVNLINAVVLLLNAYGVIHQVPYDDSFVGDGLTSDNGQADVRFQNDYMGFKNFLDGLSREYSTVSCGMQGSAVGVHLTFTCR